MSDTNNPSAFRRGLGRVWKRLRYGQLPPEDTRKGAARLKLIYERFRAILAQNDSVLQLIADMEDRLAGKYPFSLRAMEHKVQHGVLDVFVMIRDLNEISGGRWNDLYDSLRRIYEDIEKNCSESATELNGPLVLPLDDIGRADDELAGTKIANLGEARRLGLKVPDGFVITTIAFNRFMARNELWERAERLEEMLELYGPRVTAEACREVQAAIISMPVPAEVEAAILTAFDALAGPTGELLVAVRSSAVGEDKSASHAGQYLTELSVGRGWLLDAYRWVLASCYGLDPVSYRLQNGLTARDARMAVGCIRMLEPRAAGIMFSRDYREPEADRVAISATAGLSDAITRGAQCAEEILLDGGSPGEGACLSREEAERLRATARALEAHFGAPQDIEWAIEPEGEIFVLQARQMSGLKPPSLEPLPEFTDPPLLSGGITACAGAAAGPVLVIRNDDDLERLPEGGILVAPHSSPRYSRVMNRAAAIITDRGSPTGHMAIIAREFGVPTIVGMEGATRALRDGQEITVDAGNTRVFDGLLIPATGPHRNRLLLDTPAVNRLRCISGFVTPLNLIEPASADFTPLNCHTLHDIARFVHEKVFEAVFKLSERAVATGAQAYKLDGHLPYDVLVLDVGAGLAEDATADERLTLDEIRSAPMLAFLEGLLDPRIKWDQPRSVSARGFLSVLGESMAGPPPPVQGVGRPSFAVIADRYLNFSTKAGYHFNTVDSWCGSSLNKNYIHFRFEGGGAAELRRARRVRFLSLVLSARDFRVQSRGDFLVARLDKYDRETILSRLADLGRLTLCSRQLDMLMDTDDSPEYFAQAFLAGEMEKF